MNKSNHTKESIPFAQVPKCLLNDKNISFKAKGLYCYLFSQTDGFCFSTEIIANDAKDGVKAIYSAFNELKESGYLKSKKLPSGRIEYIIFFEPQKSK